MKKYILITLLLTTAISFAQVPYSANKSLVYVRTGDTKNTKPLLADFTASVVCYNALDSVIWTKENGVVTCKYTCYPYTSGKKRIVMGVNNPTSKKYGTIKKMYYGITNTAAGNLPVLSDFTTSIYRCYNITDSIVYEKRNGVVTPAYIVYPYQAYKYEYVPVLTPYARKYISTSGNDTIGNGTFSKPWRSLYKACTSVSTIGDTIYVNTGRYLELRECPLPVGVNISAPDTNSVIICKFTTTRGHDVNHGCITLASTVEGTNGNQSISNLKLIGDNLTGSIGIAVYKRSNVKISNVVIRDFFINGVTFQGQSDMFTKPTTYATGNKVNGCIISNCGNGTANWDAGGCIAWSGQDGFEVSYTKLSNTTRIVGKNGDNFMPSYYNKGWKFHHNKSYKPEDDGTVNSSTWDGANFHMEISTQTQLLNAGDELGGNEIYNNEFYGGNYVLDFPSPGNKWNYSYYASIHDNYFELNVINTTLYRSGIHLESLRLSDVLIYNNHFKGWAQPIRIIDNGGVGSTPYAYSLMDNISIYNNLIENPAMGSGTKYYVIINMNTLKAASVWSNIGFYNNTMVASTNVNHYSTLLNIVNAGVINNLNIKNNIIVGHKNIAAIRITNNNSMDNVHIDYNCFYNNAGSNDPSITGTAITNYTANSNIKTNPLFVGATDFHLQSTSPAKDAGQVITLPLVGTLPYNGSLPDIGYKEYIP